MHKQTIHSGGTVALVQKILLLYYRPEPKLYASIISGIIGLASILGIHM